MSSLVSRRHPCDTTAAVYLVLLLCLAVTSLLSCTPRSATPPVDVLMDESQADLEAERWHDAYQGFSTVLEQEPSNFPALLGLAEASLRLREASRSLELLDRALALRPADERARYLRAQALAQRRRWAEAEEVLSSLNPVEESPDLAYVAYLTYVGQGKLDEAQDVLLRAQGLYPDDPRFFWEYGDLLVGQEKIELAIAQYRAALEIEDDLPDVQAKLVVLLLETRQDLDEARTLALDAVRPGTSAGTLKAMAAYALFLQGDQDAGFAELASIVQQYPANARALYYLRLAALELNQPALVEEIEERMQQLQAEMERVSQERAREIEEMNAADELPALPSPNSEPVETVEEDLP